MIIRSLNLPNRRLAPQAVDQFFQRPGFIYPQPAVNRERGTGGIGGTEGDGGRREHQKGGGDDIERALRKLELLQKRATAGRTF